MVRKMTQTSKKRKPLPSRGLEILQGEYATLAPLADQFANELERQIQQLIQTHGIALSIPLQRRIKSWSSISEKLERKTLKLPSLKSLSDLVGLRIIVQFTRDVETIRNLLRSEFKVLEEYDSGKQLKEDQFGYSSIHFVVELPELWLSVPTMASMRGLRAEVQLRTTAQHIWAAASHTLQYKNEMSIPLPIRRAIHRVSALLETVDLEFDRVLQQRDQYRSGITTAPADVPLNVDLIESVLDSIFPPKNKSVGDEAYSDLLEELTYIKVTTVQQLEDLLRMHQATTLAHEASVVELIRSKKMGYHRYADEEARISRGVYFTHTGLARYALSCEFGDSWREPVIKARGRR